MDYAARPVRYASTYLENEEVLGWLRKEVPEEVLEPELRIVDAHHHLWDKRRGDCKYRTVVYGLLELLEDLHDGHNVIGTVYCESKCWHRCRGPAELRPVGEVEFCQGVAAACESGLYGPPGDSHTIACLGIQGQVDLLHPEVDSVLERMCRCRNFRGLRMRIANAGVLSDVALKRGLRAVERRGLVVDVWLEPSPGYQVQLLPTFAVLASEFTQITFVLNHLGGLMGPGMGGDEVEAAWRKELAYIASACSNVVCKVGGIFMPINGWGIHKRDEPPSSVELAELAFPWFSHAISCFGPERCMFESNFPVDKDSVSYRTLWNSFKRIAAKAGLSEPQKAHIFSDTAIRVYGLQTRSLKRKRDE